MTGVDEWRTEFAEEWRCARAEVKRLTSLLNDLCWYNFEVSCAQWRKPWRQSRQESYVLLHGQVWDGDALLKMPIWFAGAVRDACSCPPAIILEELDIAIDYEEACKALYDGLKDWAPGGVRYMELAETTLVGRSFSSGWVDLE